MNPDTPPRVFLSYRHESGEHADAVGELCRRLRAGGIDCRYDQSVIWPEEGWLVWMRREIKEAHFILAICSPQYRARWEVLKPAGQNEEGRGTGFEAAQLAQEIYDASGVNKRIIPVVVTRAHKGDVPSELRKYMMFDTSSKEEFERLYGLLTGQLKPELGPLGEIRKLSASPVVYRTFGGQVIDEAESADPMALRKRIARAAEYEPVNVRDLPSYEMQYMAEAAGRGDGPMIWFFSPGSGKTFAIVRRVISLVESGVAPTHILILTAADIGARQISYRLEAKLPGMFKGMMCGTFAEAALAAIRHEARHLGRTRDFSVLDEAEATALIAQLMGERLAPAPAAKVIHEIRSYSAHTMLPVEVVLIDRYPWLFWAKDAIREVLRRYKGEKAARNLVDVEDLLTGWNSLLAERPDVRESQRAVWRHVIVDQFQEVTRLQSLIVHQLVGEEGGDLLVLVDEWQSIGSRTGASLANVLALPRLYPTAARLKLETNFRSTRQIIDLINRILARDDSVFGRRVLRPGLGASGPAPKVVVLGTAAMQATWLCEEIRRLKADRVPFREMAVLYRTRASSLEAAVELNRQAIPVVSWAQPSILEQEHIQDVLACLRAAADNKDQTAWLRVLRLLPGMNRAAAKSVWNRVAQEDAASAEALLPTEAAKSWSVLRRTLTAVRKAAAPAEKVLRVLEGDFGPFLQSGFADYAECVADIRRLSAHAENFASVDELVKHIQRRQLVTMMVDPESEQPDAVCLAAIGDVRNLEFRAVFILGLARGEFPRARLAEPGGVEEERRAFYVAVTRAVSHLYMLCPGGTDELSPFLEELNGTYDRVDRTTGT